jgi:transposase
MIKRRRFFPSHESSPNFAPGTKEKMQELLKITKTSSELKRVQCILLGSVGSSSENISLLVGFHPQYVRVIWSEYRKKGEDFLLGERRGGRRNILLEQKEEEEFLAPFFEKAKTGGILIVSEIHRAHKKRIGKDIPLSSTYNLLHRHNWRKIAPRSSHPKGDEEKREEYKALVFPPTGDKGKD